MSSAIEYSDTARRALRKLDKRAAAQIVDYMDERIATAADPRAFGKALKGPLGDFWRYRVGDYRIICHIEDQVLKVLVVDLGHRRTVYR